jgi:hypothetical protein
MKFGLLYINKLVDTMVWVVSMCQVKLAQIDYTSKWLVAMQQICYMP